MKTLRGSQAIRGSQILSIGSYRPKRVVSNAEVAERAGLREDWILQRSGIASRRYAGPDEPLADMAVSAAAKAVATAGVQPAAVDCVIAATITHLVQMPALSVDVAHGLGATRAAAFDVSAACAGFCHALALASDLVQLGQADHVLVVGAERMTDIVDLTDPDTAFLFADGAGAVVVGPSSTPSIGPVGWQADGAQSHALGMSSAWTRDLLLDPTSWPVLTMSGWRLYRWATHTLVPAAWRILELAGVTVDQLDAFVLHQANMLITDQLVAELGLGEDTAVGRDIVESGNTSAASIPLAMERLLASGAAQSGDTALLLGFGAGLVFAGQVVHLP